MRFATCLARWEGTLDGRPYFRCLRCNLVQFRSRSERPACRKCGTLALFEGKAKRLPRSLIKAKQGRKRHRIAADNKSSFGQMVRDARERIKMTQEEFCGLLNLRHRAHLSRMELGNHSPNCGTFPLGIGFFFLPEQDQIDRSIEILFGRLSSENRRRVITAARKMVNGYQRPRAEPL